MHSVTWIASYPKSGNTWMRAMLTAYLKNGPIISSDEIDEAVPSFYVLLGHGRLVSLDGPRLPILKTHFLPTTDVSQLYRDSTTKVICLVRNPRDVILSAARHFGVPPEEVPVFAKEFIANRGNPQWSAIGWGTWPQSVQSWSSPSLRQSFPNAEVLTLRYEDIRVDPVEQLRQTVDFLDLGGPFEPERVRRAVENSSLERMREFELTDPAGRGRRPGSRPDLNVGQGLRNQSLADVGEDIEEAYRQLLVEDEEFSRYVRQFGYDA
jgi:hypothetical protein